MANEDDRKLRCRWCGKQPVPVKHGRIASHVTPGNLRCIGIGQPVEQMKAHAVILNTTKEKP